MRTTYRFTTFECTKCKARQELLHDVTTPAPNPSCNVPKCKGKTEYVDPDKGVQECNIGFRGLSCPPRPNSKPTLSPSLSKKWQERRVEQFKKTGK